MEGILTVVSGLSKEAKKSGVGLRSILEMV
jgi:hypothetical protein